MQFSSQTTTLTNSAGTKSTFILKSLSIDQDSTWVENKDENGAPNAQHGVRNLVTATAGFQLADKSVPAQFAEFVVEDNAGKVWGFVVKKVGQTQGNEAERAVSCDVREVLHSLVSSPLTASGKEGQTFTYTITGTGNPTSFSATGLPTGLTLDTATGIISGTPTTTGTTSVTIGATNTKGTGTTTLSLTIDA